MMEPRQPTAEECSKNTRWKQDDGSWAMALWYPQMGGYVGRAVAIMDSSDSCVDVWVWHDGQFPFSDEGGTEHRSPARIHHCDPDQFIQFGELLNLFSETIAKADE